jgi:hypothetical protein
MYGITEQERSTLTNEMVKLFNEYDYEYTLMALDKIIDTWCENKATLIEAFKKHPNYIDGKFLIAFDVDFVREIDGNVVYNFSRWVNNIADEHEIMKNLPEEAKPEYTWNVLKDRMQNALFGRALNLKSRIISEKDAEVINKARTTKVLERVLEVPIPDEIYEEMLKIV